MTTVNTSFFGPSQTFFTVPPNVTSMRWQLLGGSASYAGSLAGLAGNYPVSVAGYVAGTLSCSAGQVYAVTVGGAGGPGGNGFGSGTATGGSGGYNGGGAGGNASSSVPANLTAGNGGGGATDIRYGGTALSNRIAVAGGGGGQGGPDAMGTGQFGYTGSTPSLTPNPTSPTPPYKSSGATNYYVPSSTIGGAGGGGGPAGLGGGPAWVLTGYAGSTGGGGGSTSSGGGGGAAARSGLGVNGGSAGGLGVGGAGGSVNDTSSTAAEPNGGGGGGGGYYGGGGGSANTTENTEVPAGEGGGGGGGANFLSGSWTSTVNLGPVYPPAVTTDIADGATAYNGWAKVTYVQVPNAPQLSTPATGGSFDVNSQLTFAWAFSSPDPTATQGGFEIDYEVTGSGTWTALSFPTGQAKQYSFASAMFTSGTSYDFRVRVYDNVGDVSPWTTVTLNAITLPTAPTVTAPTAGSPATTSPFNVTWTIPSGTIELYRVQILGTNGQTLIDSGEKNSTRRNLCTNPNFGTNTTGWAQNGSGTNSVATGYAKYGSNSMQVVWQPNAAQAEIYLMNTTPGTTYTASVWIAQRTGANASPAVQMGAANPGYACYTFGTTTGTFTNDVWQQISVTFKAQQSQTNIVLLATAGSASTTFVSACLIEQGSLANTHMTYFDGGNANGQTGTPSWSGTANASISLLTISNVLSFPVTWTANSQAVTAYVTYSLTTSNGFYSNSGSGTFAININPPPAPTCSLAVDATNARMTLSIANGSGSFPAIYNDIFRTDLTTGEAEKRIATRQPINTPYVDNTPAGNRTYAYRVRAYSSSGGYADAS